MSVQSGTALSESRARYSGICFQGNCDDSINNSLLAFLGGCKFCGLHLILQHKDKRKSTGVKYGEYGRYFTGSSRPIYRFYHEKWCCQETSVTRYFGSCLLMAESELLT